nr:Arm DNA-binding domain-containing protein [Caenibius sp. WL]
MTDGAGMFLLVTPAGGKLWRLKYRIDGREKLLAMGAYPDVSLSEARRRRGRSPRTDRGGQGSLAGETAR